MHGEGYLPIPERVGSMAHVGFDVVESDGERVVIAERLTWHPYTGELWADEERRIEIHDVDDRVGLVGADLDERDHQPPRRAAAVRQPDDRRA